MSTEHILINWKGDFIMMQANNYEHAIKLFPFFSELNLKDWKLARPLKINSNLIYEKHELHDVMFLLSGSLRIYKIGNTGREITLYRIHSGETCVLMLASILGELDYEASIEVETETEILLFPIESFRKWMDRYKPMRQWVYKQFVLRWTSIADLLEQIAFSSTYDRIMKFFIERQQVLGASNSIIKMTHEQMAIELGTSREVISRALKAFSDKGAITTHRGKIKIINLKKMSN